MAKSLQDYIDEKERKQTASSSSSKEKNQGGFWGGAEYLGTRLVDGLVSNVEGIVDFTVGGLADLFGADKFAERQFANDWYNYNRADEKYNPGKGMSVAGDIVGVVGGALPDIGIGLLTGGAGLGAKIIGKGISLGTSFASSAGRGVSEAVGKTGELGGKEWAGGLGSGGLAAGIEAASGGLGDLFGGVFGKTGVEMGSELAESFGKKASTETVGNIFGKIAGKEAAGEVGEGVGKKLISKLWNSKFGKELLGEMVSEGIEEGLETWIEPEIIQGTYDPTRPNATIGDIAYSAMLGGLGGGLISGGLGGISGAVNKTRLTTRGGTISNDSTKLNNLMHNAEVIANYENNKQTGSQIFSQVESLYNDVKASLEKNGGKVTLATMENIGRLDALVAASTVQPSIVNAAKGIAKNAESMAAALNNFYSRNGQSSNITAEQLTAGLKLKGTSQEFVASVTDALNTNPTFRQVVMNNMLGNMEFDAQSYARSIYGDMDIRNIATQQNLNRFLSTADAATLGKAGEALGITDWSRVTPEELAQRIYDYRDSGRAELTREGISAVREAKEAQGYTNGMPTSLSALTEGATRFQSPGADFAIVRHGNSYRLYDYETGKITNAMSEGDMAALVQRIKDRQAEIGRQSEMQALDRELDNFANENVPEYKKLSEGEKEAVRATLRYARANGVSLKDQILFARIAAKSGMNIIVKQKLEDGKAAWFDGVNSIYLDANAPRTRGFKGLLGHEMFHKLFQNDTDRKLFKKAYDAVPEADRDEIEARYTDMYEKLNVHSEQEIQDISSEEVAAAYAEELFNTPDVWSYILDGEPSIKDKVLAFFGKAPERYDFAKEMEPAAREWLQEYKQLFDSVAEYNAGGTLAANVGTTLMTERTIQRVGKVVDDNTTGIDNGERFAFAGENAKTADKLKLSTAKKMIEDGIDSETVRKETGWFRGYDGKWRFEIDDSQMEVNLSGNFTNPDVVKYKSLEQRFLTEPETMTADDISELQILASNLKGVKKTPTTLGDYVKHDALFAAYPELKDVKVTFDKISSDGKYKSNSNEIVLDNSLRTDAKRLKKTLAHEIEHVIQKIEGFTKGSNVEYWKKQRESLSEDIKAARENLGYWLKDIGYSDYVKKSMSEVAAGKKSLNDHWKDIESFKKKSQYARQIETSEAEISKLESRLKQLLESGNDYDLYEKTAGEIEARDVENRLDMTEEQRKNTRPDIDRTDVVFADGSNVSYFAKDEYDAETAGIRDQIKNAQEMLNRMPLVYTANVPYKVGSKENAGTWAISELKKYGFQVDRKDFGKIYFGEKAIRDAMNYLDTDAEKVSIVGIYKVLKQGIQIGEHTDHKQRGKHTITFAAPVELNGKRGNMAVVVNLRNNQYKVHRIVMPDGSVFKFDVTKNNAEQESQRGVPNRSLANATSSASIDSLTENAENVKAFDKKSAKDFNSGERSALADGKKATTSDVAAAKRAIRESGIDPSGIIAVADKYFDRYGGELTRTGVRYEFLGAAETMLEDDAGAMERAYAKIEALADELTYNEKNANSLREDLDQIKRHVREITFEIRDKDKGEFDSLGGYNEFRKKHFGKLKIGSEGASIDSTYGELQNQYGTSFFPEVNTVAEMLIRIGDVVDMDPNFETESDIDLEAARNDMAVAITGELGSAFDKKLAAKAEKLSKSDAEAYKARITARAETKAAKEIARAKKRLEKIEAKLRAQAEKQIADAGKKLNETLETERTKLTAEYETDKVFSQSSVKNNLGTVDAFKTLPAAERSEISRRVWKDFSESNGYDSREWLVIKHSAELVDAICKAKPDGVSKYERDAIADQVNAALKKIAAGGKTSVRGRMEGELREEIKAQESVKRELLSDIYQELKKIDDVKTARFVAASDYKGADFKGSINSLTKMDWRGRLNDSIVRSEMKNLLSWYHPDNPMLKGFESGDFKVTNYDQGIKERLDLLANGQGELSNTELSMLADTLRYFTKLVGEYDSVYVEGKWQSGEKLVYQMRDNIEKQNKMKVPMAVRALRNRVLSGDLRAFADPLSVMKLADMYEDGIFTKVYKDWMQGEINADAEALNIKSEYDAFMKSNRKYLARAEKDTVTLHGVEINRLQLVSYVMTLKRKGSWLGVASDGVVFRDKNGRDVPMRPVVPIDNGPGFNKKLEAAIKAEQGIAERLLTNKDKEYMQILERGFEKAKVTKAAGDMQRLGFVNVVDGYYYPIRRAYTEHISEFEAELLATDRYANASFNKKTIERAKSALLISSADSVFNSHINGVTGYMYLSPVMDSFNKLYKLKALKTKPGDGADIGALYALPGSTFSLQSLIGQSPSTWRQDGKVVGFDYLQNLMLDTMGGRTRLVGDDWAGKLRAGYVGFALGGNIKTMATQLSSMFASTSVLQPFNHLKSVVSWRGGMDKYSTVAKLRDSDYTILKSTAVTDQVNRFAAWFTKGMSLMDRLVVYRAWNAAQMQVAQKGGPKLGTEENLIAAGKLLDKVILETQQNAFTSRKTEAARRGNSIVKAMIMFKSDAITTQGRIIDAWGELQYLTATKKGVEAESKAEAKKQIKTAKKQLSKAVGAVVASSAYMVAIAELFRAFYGKLDKDEEDEEKATRLRGEFILNALGGIPVISAIAEAFSSSYDFESMEFSAINDILDTAKQCRDYFDDVFAGKATERDGLKMIERALYGAGQLFGIPLRNLKNLSYGITRLISPEAAYKWDSALYSQTYGKDLTDALEKEDYQMAEVILETAFGEKMGSGLSDDAIKVLSRLAKNGENVIPSAVSDKITIDGEERELTGEELKAVREKYGEAVEQINKIIQTDVFRDFDDEMKADAVRKIYDLYKNLAYDGAVGSKKDEEAYLLSKVVDADVLCLNEILSIYTADVDENGKTVSGSKRGKVIAAISDMDISDEEKLLLIATQGYALKDDDIYGMSKEKADELLFDYIASLDLSDEERLALYKYAGYDVKDGEVSGSAASGSSGSATSGSSGSSKKSFSGSLANPSGILYKATKNRARRIGKIV